MASEMPDYSLDNQSTSASVILISSVTCGLALIVVILRVYTRAVIVRPMGADDWSIVVAMVNIPVLNEVHLTIANTQCRYWQ